MVKQDGTVRLCGDYRVTVNKAVKVDSYPLPRVEELFAALSGGKYFTKLAMSQAYLQLPLDKQSRELVTINTHRRLFQYTRLPFGVSAAPGVFQRCMENSLQGCKGVSVYLDDILVTGSTVDEHLQNLDKVLNKLEMAGLKLNKAKCSFLMPQVEYLGHTNMGYTLVKKLIQQMLTKNIIQPSTSPWASSVVIMWKKDGSARFWVDYRKLNLLRMTGQNSLHYP